MKVLFINACIRGKSSRTARLCRAALGEISAIWEDTELMEADLNRKLPLPLDAERLQKRSQWLSAGNFSDPMFDYAKEFAQADMIVVGAPYWDLSFPALLKIYLEQTCVNGITFYYDEMGKVQSLCAARKVLYITTAGGFIGEDNFGYQYIQGLFLHHYGMPGVDFVSAEGLDIVGATEERILGGAERTVRAIIQSWK